MCLAIPGRVEFIEEGEPLQRTAQVSFGGTAKSVNLAFVPEAAVGDYVLVHVGVALSVIDEAEARQVFAYLAEIDELQEIEEETG